MTPIRRLRLFGLGVALGVAMYLVGGIAVPLSHTNDSAPTAKLAPSLCTVPQPAGCSP